MIEEERVIIHEKVKLFFWPKGKVLITIVHFSAWKIQKTYVISTYKNALLYTKSAR